MQGYREMNRALRQELSVQTDFLRFQLDRLKRGRKYRSLRRSIEPHDAVLRQLREDGFAVLRGRADKGPLLELRREMEAHLDSGRHLTGVSKDSARVAGDLGGAAVYLGEEELAQGQEYYRSHTNYASIADPLLNCPAAARFVFADLLIDIAAGYFGCVPGVGGLNLRKSFVNDLPEFDTLHFHSDGNSPRFVKFFYYLNDVDRDGGPFCYVRGSHREKFKGWRSKYRWTPDEIESIYGSDRVTYLTADVGDVIVADTTGFHRGTKVRARDRSMLTVNYTVHPEYWSVHPAYKLDSASYEGLSAKQKAVTDFAEIVRG
jgi:hypothetical protein